MSCLSEKGLPASLQTLEGQAGAPGGDGQSLPYEGMPPSAHSVVSGSHFCSCHPSSAHPQVLAQTGPNFTSCPDISPFLILAKKGSLEVGPSLSGPLRSEG